MVHAARQRPGRKRPRVETTSTRILAPRRLTTSCASNDPPAEEAEEDDVGGGETRDEGYHRLRQEMGVAEADEEAPRCSGFSEARLEAVRQYFSAGGDTNYINRVGQFLRILGHLLGDVGYTCEAMLAGGGSDTVHTREPEGDNSYLMQRPFDPNQPSSSTLPARERPPSGSAASATQHAPLGEEDLSPEGRAIMEACEKDGTWQTINRMRGSAKEKFLTCLCVMIQEWWRTRRVQRGSEVGRGAMGRR